MINKYARDNSPFLLLYKTQYLQVLTVFSTFRMLFTSTTNSLNSFSAYFEIKVIFVKKNVTYISVISDILINQISMARRMH